MVARTALTRPTPATSRGAACAGLAAHHGIAPVGKVLILLVYQGIGREGARKEPRWQAGLQATSEQWVRQSFRHRTARAMAPCAATTLTHERDAYAYFSAGAPPPPPPGAPPPPGGPPPPAGGGDDEYTGACGRSGARLSCTPQGCAERRLPRHDCCPGNFRSRR